MNPGKKRVCPVGRAGTLDNVIRRWVQDPRKILTPYIAEEMTVLDFGCGPGFFSIEIARMVGKSGRVIASDLQEGMLQKLRDKIQGTELEERIALQRCEENKISVSDMPLIVLSHGKKGVIPGMSAEMINQREQVWNELQADHAGRSRNGIRVIAEKSGHNIQYDQPELVIDAVRRVVEAVRAR